MSGHGKTGSSMPEGEEAQCQVKAIQSETQDGAHSQKIVNLANVNPLTKIHCAMMFGFYATQMLS